MSQGGESSIEQLEPGRIGRYVVLGTLGEGAFATVKEGLIEETHERVALKLLDGRRLSAKSRLQAEREIQALSLLDHQNIVRLREAVWSVRWTDGGETKDSIMLVLDLVPNGELFAFLDMTGAFDEPLARTYFQQIISALSYSHSKGVAHRDLKPENILLDDQFNLKLADWGLSCLFDSSQRQMHTNIGTPLYKAPEMLSGSGYDPVVADVWAAGVVLFIMLAQFPPFEAPRETDWWFNKLQTGRHELFWRAHCRKVDFSEGAKDLLNKILCPDPSRRITINDIRKHPWFNGPTLDPSALYAEMSRRCDVFKQSNLKKKAQQEGKIRREAEATAIGATQAPSVQLEETVYRDITPSLPPESPSLTSRSFFDFSSCSSSFAAAAAAEAENAAAAVLPLPPRYRKSGAVCYTKLESAKAPYDVLQRVAAVLSKKGQTQTDQKMYTVRSQVKTEAGPVQLTVQISVKEEGGNPPVTVAEFRRGEGDSSQFRKIFLEVLASVSDLLESEEESGASSSGFPFTS